LALKKDLGEHSASGGGQKVIAVGRGKNTTSVWVVLQCGRRQGKVQQIFGRWCYGCQFCAFDLR